MIRESETRRSTRTRRVCASRDMLGQEESATSLEGVSDGCWLAGESEREAAGLPEVARVTCSGPADLLDPGGLANPPGSA